MASSCTVSMSTRLMLYRGNYDWVIPVVTKCGGRDYPPVTGVQLSTPVKRKKSEPLDGFWFREKSNFRK